MSFDRVNQSTSQNLQTTWSKLRVSPRRFLASELQRSPTEEEIENQAFEQDKYEATGLQLKEKHGTITPVEQERLSMLQAKMSNTWAQRTEQGKVRPNLLEILTRNAQTTQTSEPVAPVQPKLTIGQPNDRYEQEADRVAQEVMSMASPTTPNTLQSQFSTGTQKSGYSSPALQMRSQLRTSLGFSPLIQRAVTTSGGEWDTDQYDLVKDSAGGTAYPPAAGIRGVDMKLKFTPNDTVDAELIGLTQSVQGFVNNAPKLTPAAATRAIPSKDAIGINTGAGETDEGTAIDQSETNRNPLYAIEGAPATDTNLSDTLPVAGDVTKGNRWGQHGFRYKDASGTLKTQSALLIDEPRRSGAAKDSRHIFEATALAVKGTQAGTYYGSVRWGWRTDDKENFTKIPLTVVSQGVPSSTFMKAAGIWNAAKTSAGADTLDLPIVDVKVTTGPVTLMPPVPLRHISLPVGTRVQILEEWHPPLLNGKIKVVDGPSTGVIGDVTYEEWGNIVDERP